MNPSDGGISGPAVHHQARWTESLHIAAYLDFYPSLSPLGDVVGASREDFRSSA